MKGSEWSFREDQSWPLEVATEWVLNSIVDSESRSRLLEVVFKRRGWLRRKVYALEVDEIQSNGQAMDRRIIGTLTSTRGCILLTNPPAEPPTEYELYRDKLSAKVAIRASMCELPEEFELILEKLLLETNRVAFVGWDGDYIVYFDRD